MKGVCPGHRLPPGILSEGASAIKNGNHNRINHVNLDILLALEGFNKVKKADLVNEKRPEIFYSAYSTQPIGPNLKNLHSKPYPQISNNSENSFKSVNDVIPPKPSNKINNYDNSITSSVTHLNNHKTMAAINSFAKDASNNFDGLTNKKGSGGNDSKESNGKIGDKKRSVSPNRNFGPNSNSNRPVVYSENTPKNNNQGVLTNSKNLTMNKKKG